MITSERIYEVFGFEDNSNLNNWHFHFEDGEFYIYEASPGMLVVLVNIVYNFEKFCHVIGDRTYETDYSCAIKAIELVDSQGREWPEIKLLLEKK